MASGQAVGSTVGGIAGTYFGPVGTAAGSFLGGIVGGLIGGEQKYPSMKKSAEVLRVLGAPVWFGAAAIRYSLGVSSDLGKRQATMQAIAAEVQKRLGGRSIGTGSGLSSSSYWSEAWRLAGG